MKKRFLFCAFFFAALCPLIFSLYAASNASKTEKFSLKNGIPVYYKSVDSTRMCSVIVTISGGTSMHTREFSGLESALLELMSRSSKNNSPQKIKQLGYEKHISFSHGTSSAGSTFSLSCIDYYFDEALAVFLDLLLNPSFDETEFSQMLTEYNQGIQRTLNNPQSLLTYTIKKEVYKDHPLGASASVLPESIENITRENVVALYDTLINPARMSVVAAGSLNPKKLAKTLDKNLGRLSSDLEFSKKELPPISVGGENIVLQNAAISGSGHIARVFESPSILSDDFIPARIAAQMYNEVLFNVVRTRYGACYTPSTSIDFSAAPFGLDFLYRVSDLQNITKYLKEAQTDFASGKMLASFDEKDGKIEYDSIEERLPGFVNKYITSAYGNQQTCASIAARAANGLLQLNDIDGLDAFVERAKDVSASDVMRVFKKYWVDSSSRFFAVVGQEDTGKVRFD